MPGLDKKRVAEIYTAGKREQWPYPKIFEALEAAGVEGYIVDVASHTVIYYGDNTSCIENSPAGFSGITPNKHFAAAAVQSAIERNLGKAFNDSMFLQEMARAGVISYRVEMKARTVTYKGWSGEEYVEPVRQ